MNSAISTKPIVRVLKARRATPEALAPYGEILGPNPAIAPLPIDFYGGKAKVRRVVNFESDSETEMPLVTLDYRPLEVSHMERHPKHTQAFISLGSKPFVAVFAPPSEAELPDIDAGRRANPPTHRVLGWALEPGDAVAFHMLTLHAAGGVEPGRRRRVFSVRFLGDDMRHAPRRWKTSPDFPGLADSLPAGAPLAHALFPLVWEAPA